MCLVLLWWCQASHIISLILVALIIVAETVKLIIVDEYEISKLPEEVQIEIAKELSIKEDRLYHMSEDEKIKIAKTLSTHVS